MVTGGAGFIGSHLVDALLERGASVRVLDDLSTGRESNLSGARGDLSFLRGSILDAPVLAKAIDGCEAVFHLAAVASVPRSIEDPIGTGQVNIEGTVQILQAAARAKAKVVFSSSSAIYGNPATLPVDEKSLPMTLSPYAAQKLAGEAHLAAFHASIGLPSVALRYFNVFGPRQDPESEYAAVIPKFVTRALQNRPLIIFGDGGQTRDFIYVGDVARANVMAFESKIADGRPFNLGSGTCISVLELAKTVIAQTGSTSEVEFQPARSGEVRLSEGVVDRARNEIGFVAQISLGEGLRQTASYWREALPA